MENGRIGSYPLLMVSIRATRDLAVRLYRWTGLTLRGLVALLAALATVAGAGLMVAALSEDVITGDGSAKDDPGVLRAIVDHRTGWLVRLARFVTQFGAVGVLGIVALLAGALLWWRGARLVHALSPLVALGIAGFLAAVGKTLIDRARPPLGFRLLRETEASFPSGHATDSTAVFVAIALVVAITLLHSARLRAAVVGASGLAAGLIGASRLELGVHWPTDVLAGWGIGLMVAVSVTTAATLIARATPAPPDATPHRRRAQVHALLAKRRPSTLARSSAA
jgi:membrane-associated phospholipid phosphatase